MLKSYSNDTFTNLAVKVKSVLCFLEKPESYKFYRNLSSRVLSFIEKT